MSKSDELYVGVADSLVRQDNDELYEFYVTLDDLLEAAENEEIEDLCLISAEDFTSVRTRYQDQMVNYCQTGSPIQAPPEPVIDCIISCVPIYKSGAKIRLSEQKTK